MKLQALPDEGPRLQADPKGLTSAPRLGKWTILGGDYVGRENVWEASCKKRRSGGDEGAGEPQSRRRRAQGWRDPRETVQWEKSTLLLPTAQREGRQKMGKAPQAILPGETEHSPHAPCSVQHQENARLGISFSPGGPEGQFSGLPFLRILMQSSTDGSGHYGDGVSGIRSPWLEFFLIPLHPLSLRQ